MKGVDRSLSSKPGTPESRIKAAQYEMKKVEGYWNDLQKKYPDMLGHPDVVVAKGGMDAYYDKIDDYGKAVSEEKAKEGQAKSTKEVGSNEWIAKLTPSLLIRGQQGYVPEKEFIASYTEDPKDMDQRMKLYVEASTCSTSIRKLNFRRERRTNFWIWKRNWPIS